MEREINAKIMTIRVPHEAMSKKALCYRVKRKLLMENGVEPSFEEIAEHLDWSLGTVIRVMAAPTPKSMDSLHRTVHDDNNVTVEEVIEDSNAIIPSDEVDYNLTIEYLMRIIDEELNERNADILKRYYGIGYRPQSMKTIGENHERSIARVGQIVKRIIVKIKSAAHRDGLL
jgi:RNA polymerase primary sigma factor